MEFFSLTEMNVLFRSISPAKRATYCPYLIAAMTEFEINTSRRIAAFLAQIGHETGGLVYMSEIWGPTVQQRKYDPPHKLAAGLGNTQKGDGKRFRGRGAIQLTGRSNYALASGRFNYDFVADPDAVSKPDWAFRMAGYYWDRHNLNQYADTDQFIMLTRRINGGTNGLMDRQRRWKQAKDLLGVTPYEKGIEEPVLG